MSEESRRAFLGAIAVFLLTFSALLVLQAVAEDPVDWISVGHALGGVIATLSTLPVPLMLLALILLIVVPWLFGVLFRRWLRKLDRTHTATPDENTAKEAPNA